MMPSRCIGVVAVVAGFLIYTPLLVESLRAEDALANELFVNGTEEDDEHMGVQDVQGESFAEGLHQDGEAEQKSHGAKNSKANATTHAGCDSDCGCGPADDLWWWKDKDAGYDVTECTCERENSMKVDQVSCQVIPEEYTNPSTGKPCTWSGVDENECYQHAERFMRPEQGLAEDVPAHENQHEVTEDLSTGNTFNWQPGAVRVVGQRTAGATYWGAPVISQNSLINTASKGDHACWAVARATAGKFAGVYGRTPGKQGTKEEAMRYYKNRGENTGWYLPTNARGKTYMIARATANWIGAGQPGFANTMAEFAMAMGDIFKNNRIIIAAMSGGDDTCSNTFHYVTFIGMALIQGCAWENGNDFSGGIPSDDFVKSCLEFIAIDQWCPEYGSYGGTYFTQEDKDSVLWFKDDSKQPKMKDHPCIKAVSMTEVHATKGKPVFGGWNYASEPRCIFKGYHVKQGVKH